MTIAYSAVGSVGISISAVDGVCGSVEGRGILFEREVPPVENILQSFLLGESKFEIDRDMLEREPVTGRIECIPALERLEKVAWSARCKYMPATTREGDGCWTGDDGDELGKRR